MKHLAAAAILAFAGLAYAQTNSQDVNRVAEQLVQIDKAQREAAAARPATVSESRKVSPWIWLLAPVILVASALAFRKK